MAIKKLAHTHVVYSINVKHQKQHTNQLKPDLPKIDEKNKPLEMNDYEKNEDSHLMFASSLDSNLVVVYHLFLKGIY